MAATQTSADSILQVEHLSMKFGGLVAIGDLSFQAKRGEITALIGPNGAGKTTVFNCITGFYKPSEGMIRLNRKSGQEFLLERMPDFQITAKAKVARTFQNIRLFSGMTLLENLLVAQHNKLMLASGYTVLGLLGIGGYRKASAESVELAKFWLEKADLVDRADDPAGDLPYGAQRRLEIARAMCTGPELLCLDEPAAGLNPKESQSLNSLLIDIKQSMGTSILLIEHDMSVVMQISDHVVVLEYGRKISDGDPESVRNDPRVIAAYLGVDDEEVTDVLAEVGDGQVLDQLDGTADRAHGPQDSSSMMAGSVSETIAHSDDHGERVTVAAGASKADQSDATLARNASAAKTGAAQGKSSVRKTASGKAAAAKTAAEAGSVDAGSAAATGPEAGAPAAMAVSSGKAATARKSSAASGKASSAKAPRSAKASASVKTASGSSKAAAGSSASQASSAAGSIAASPATKDSRSSPSAKPSVGKAASAVATDAGTGPNAAAGRVAGAKAKSPTAARSAGPVATENAAASATAARPTKPAPARSVARPKADPAAGPPEKLTVIKGIGPVNERKLNEHGIFRFAQIAAWTKADIVAVEAYLAFDGRIAREDWIGQAKALAKAAGKPAQPKRGGAK